MRSQALRLMLALLAASAAFTAVGQSAPAKGEAEPSGARLMQRKVEPIKPGSEADRVRNAVRERLGREADSVQRLPMGLYEVIFGTQIVYVDPEVKYLISGRMIDTENRVDLTSQRRDEISRVDFKSLPLKQAIKLVRGDGGKGKRTLVTFEDPNCGYCRRLAKTIKALDNVTVYTFLYPILSQDSHDKSKGVWCAKDRAEAWLALMLEGKEPAAAGEACETPLEGNVAMGRTLGIGGTPTLIFPDGWRSAGAMDLQGIEQALADHSAP